MMDSGFKRVCMRDRIRDVLVARILDGTYPSGLQLKELSLAREFNVSQAPIREALRELEGTGLVTSERYRGTRVRGADLVEMRESYELRLMMEVHSIERGLPLTPAMLEKLESYLTNMADAVARFSRLTWKTIWLTPLAADPGFEPRTAGLVAAKPFLDVLGDGGSIDQICAHVLQLADARAA